MSERQQIRNYLQSLSRYLAPLQEDEANEVVKEIESHIFDVIDSCEAAGNTADIEQILARLGPPRVLAESYVSHVQTGTPPPAGFKALSGVKKGLSVTFYYGLSLLGYSIGACLIILAFANLIVPNGVGIWSAAGGESIVIGFIAAPHLQQAESIAQGFWITPVALVMGYLIILMTHRILKFIKHASSTQRYA